MFLAPLTLPTRLGCGSVTIRVVVLSSHLTVNRQRPQTTVVSFELFCGVHIYLTALPMLNASPFSLQSAEWPDYVTYIFKLITFLLKWLEVSVVIAEIIDIHLI